MIHHGSTVYRQAYAGDWRYAQPGLDYVSVGMQGGYMAEWQPYDRSPRVISLALSDDPYSGRDKLIMNQLTLATGETDYFYGYVLNYERPDLGRDSDGDGIIDALDIDLDGDGIWNAADTDRDGDGVDNDQDSHPMILTRALIRMPIAWVITLIGPLKIRLSNLTVITTAPAIMLMRMTTTTVRAMWMNGPVVLIRWMRVL